MAARKHIGIWVLILAIPLLIAACSDDDNNVPQVAPASPTSTGVWVIADNTRLPADNVAAFNGDNTYYNVHSAVFPGGEIRGQIDFDPTAVKFASLDNAQEVPPTTSTVKGAGILAFNAVDNHIAGFVVTSGIAGTQAHIHVGARGVDGGILIPLVGGPSHWFVPDNTTLPADNVASFNNNTLYFNVHTALFPGGEIRGQIDKTPTVGGTKFASLNGAQETPPNASTVKGAGVAAFNAGDNTIAGFVVTTGIAGTQAHIHFGARGVGGPIVVPLVGGPSHWFFADNAVLPADNVAAFNGDNTYYNVHSAAFPGGEVRGQIDVTPTVVKFAALDNTQEPPPNASTGKGAGIAAFDGAALDNTIAGFVVTTGVNGTQGHLHRGARGFVGPIVVPLLPSP